MKARCSWHRAFVDRDVVVLRESHDQAGRPKFSPVPGSGTWSRFASSCAGWSSASRCFTSVRTAIGAIGTARSDAALKRAGASFVRDGVATNRASWARPITATANVLTESASGA